MSVDPHVSRREAELLDWASRGLHNKAIAARMGITEGGVKKYFARLRDKFTDIRHNPDLSARIILATRWKDKELFRSIKFCGKGLHRMVGYNIGVRPCDGFRYCRACKREWCKLNMRKRRARQKENSVQ